MPSQDRLGGGEPAARPAEKQALAGRYRLRALLGRGGYGEVWEADDEVLGERVAIKRLIHANAESARVRREIATLRMLHLPGVVRLLDEGIDEGQPFFVMELVAGAPFPGGAREAGAPVGLTSDTISVGATVASSSDVIAHLTARARAARWEWTAIAAPTEALLETLSRVHAAGIVHRDLKPANVLVREDGRPMVLDFGLSFRDAGDARMTQEGRILGTPAYLSPEQIRGGSVDARADLYAVGAMVYEALTASLPHEAPTVEGLLMLRLAHPAVPVRDRVPEIPPGVADLVDRLLARSPAHRPRSAADALAMLRGGPESRRVDHALPRLGGDAHVQAIVAAARAGRAIDVTGPRGSGKTRCLDDAAEALAREGRTVIHLPRASRPLASVTPVTGPLDDLAREPLDEVIERASARVAEELANGVVLVADDPDRMDVWSRDVLARCRGAGAVIRAVPAERAGEGAIDLGPLDEEALRPLFSGPDRLFHLREDGARVLWERTFGLPSRIVDEIGAWLRAGLCRWDGARIVVERDALDRLGSDLPVASALVDAGVTGPAADEPHLEELLSWLCVVGARLTSPRLAEVMGQPRFRVEAELGELCARGLARRIDEARFEPLVHTHGAWSEDDLRRAHLAAAHALPPGAPGRLVFLVAGGEDELVAREALTLARRTAEEGHLGRAVAALHEGVLAARRCAVETVETEILAEWVKVGFADRRAHALDRVLYEICRARGHRGADIAHLEGLVRAAILVDGPRGRQAALEAADALGMFDDPELERWRHWVRVRAGIRESPEAAEAALAEARGWAARTGHPVARVAIAGWQGLIAYEHGRFEESARCHAEAAEGEVWLSLRLASTLNEAAALLEAFQPREAADRARVAGDMASRARHAYSEARAEWTRCTAAYRMGAATTPDLELVEAFAALGASDHFALICLTQAAIAYRGGVLEVAAELASRALEVWQRNERRWGALLSRCFLSAVRGGLSEGEAQTLAAEATSCPVPGIGIQALAFVRLSCPALPPFPDDVLAPLCSAIPEERWGERLDVLSVRESLDAARG